MNSRPWFSEGIFGIPAKTALAKLLLQDSCGPPVLMGFAEVKSYLFISDYLIFYMLSLNVEYPPDSAVVDGFQQIIVFLGDRFHNSHPQRVASIAKGL